MTDTTKEKPVVTEIDSRTGDRPAETPGHVIPGQDLRSRWGVAPPKVADKPAEKPAEDKPIPPKGPDGKFVKKPKAKPVAAPAPAIDATTLATAVATGVKTALDAGKPAAPAAPDPLAGLTQKQKRKYEVIQRMEKLNPENKGKAEAYAKAASDLAKYQADWSAKNKGKEFKIDDDEHSDFMADHDVQVDDDEYAEAVADLRADERTKEAMKPIEQKLKERDELEAAQKRIAELNPVVEGHAKSTAKAMFSLIGEEFKGVLDEGGKIVHAEVKKLLEANPTNKVVFNLAAQTENVASELMRLARGAAKFMTEPPDRARYPDEQEFKQKMATHQLHVHIAEYAIGQDRLMSEMPDEKQLDSEGRQFATMEQWNALTPDQQKTRWHFSDADLSQLYAVDQAKTARGILENSEKQFQAELARRGIKPATPAAPAAPAPNRRAKEEPSPSGAIAPTISPKTAQDTVSENSATKSLKLRWIG